MTEERNSSFEYKALGVITGTDNTHIGQDHSVDYLIWGKQITFPGSWKRKTFGPYKETVDENNWATITAGFPGCRVKLYFH